MLQRKLRNCYAKRAWKAKFKLENRERIKKGLPALKRPYGRGKAWRQRGAFRKQLGLPLGPTTYTTAKVKWGF
jgi:hypothetical protein